MKKMVVTMMILLAAACCFADTFTVTLVSKVEKVEAQYAIRNNETGATGAAVIYTTDAIANQDVTTSFDIIQTNKSNWGRRVAFQVSATELVANVEGKTYSTEGVSIVMNGEQCGSSVGFVREFKGVTAAGTTVGSFEVVWQSNASLVEATYEACITLSATAL